MLRIFTNALCTILLTISTAHAVDVSNEDLVGLWEFTAYAEVSEPEVRQPVSAKFDIRGDGTLITTTSSKEGEARLVFAGDTITYSDERGDQIWEVQSFEPGKSLVILNGGQTLMFLEMDSSR